MCGQVSSLDAVLDSLADHAIFRLDDSGRVKSWNFAAEKTKGYSADEIVGQNFDVFYTPEDREAGLPSKSLHTALEAGHFKTEGWRLRKDGSRFWADVTIQPLKTPSGENDGYVKVTRNADDRLAMEKLREELQHSQKMELIGQLTSGIAHDFNTLLTTIESTYELIGLSSKDERISRYLGANRVAIAHSRKLTSQLLAFSRKQTLNPTLLDVNETASGFDGLFKQVVGDQIRIIWYLDYDLPYVNIDGGHLQSALMNLVINARDAMPHGGTVTIFSEIRDIPVDAAPPPFHVLPGPYLAIGVTDTGTGMSNDVVRRCVEPFFTTKEIGRGTGLGLSQCFGFAKQSGGTLEIRSVEGAGTTVTILLPVPKGASLPNPQQRTVLLVEDDPAVRDLASELLRTLGHIVVEASDATEALSHLQHDSAIDLLFTDIMMPGINGVELLMKARQIRPGLPAMLTSGYTQNMLIGTSDLPENAPFLRKPYTLDDLRETLREHPLEWRQTISSRRF